MKLLIVLRNLKNIIKNIEKYGLIEPKEFKLCGDITPVFTMYINTIDTQVFESLLIDTLMITLLNKITVNDIDDIIDYVFYFEPDKHMIKYKNIEIDTEVVKGIMTNWNDKIYEMYITEKHKDKLNYIMHRNLLKLLKN